MKLQPHGTIIDWCMSSSGPTNINSVPHNTAIDAAPLRAQEGTCIHVEDGQKPISVSSCHQNNASTHLINNAIKILYRAVFGYCSKVNGAVADASPGDERETYRECAQARAQCVGIHTKQHH